MSDQPTEQAIKQVPQLAPRQARALPITIDPNAVFIGYEGAATDYKRPVDIDGLAPEPNVAHLHFTSMDQLPELVRIWQDREAQRSLYPFLFAAPDVARAFVDASLPGWRDAVLSNTPCPFTTAELATPLNLTVAPWICGQHPNGCPDRADGCWDEEQDIHLSQPNPALIATTASSADRVALLAKIDDGIRHLSWDLYPASESFDPDWFTNLCPATVQELWDQEVRCRIADRGTALAHQLLWEPGLGWFLVLSREYGEAPALNSQVERLRYLIPGPEAEGWLAALRALKQEHELPVVWRQLIKDIRTFVGKHEDMPSDSWIAGRLRKLGLQEPSPVKKERTKPDPVTKVEATRSMAHREATRIQAALYLARRYFKRGEKPTATQVVKLMRAQGAQGSDKKLRKYFKDAWKKLESGEESLE